MIKDQFNRYKYFDLKLRWPEQFLSVRKQGEYFDIVLNNKWEIIVGAHANYELKRLTQEIANKDRRIKELTLALEDTEDKLIKCETERDRPIKLNKC
ncbi:MAG: hypothetical protein Q8R83_00920 [Legionellaceae bacterium]|nr:hypothetical protein [Legionellaceae bacterium]